MAGIGISTFYGKIKGNRTEAERILYKTVEGDLELSDDERDEDEFQPVREDSDEEEEDDAEGSGEGTDADTDRDEQETQRPLWARSNIFARVTWASSVSR
ncbi:nucleolar protein 12-like [Carassius auratus]|uniref:Nucleolar protein 12-like n=1 Tax=Carassius auratus TaxID=7957 RepID=A0A6P6NRS5_CARAU|nr:nucleolar protein 12-like [Carassius auratus]